MISYICRISLKRICIQVGSSACSCYRVHIIVPPVVSAVISYLLGLWIDARGLLLPFSSLWLLRSWHGVNVRKAPVKRQSDQITSQCGGPAGNRYEKPIYRMTKCNQNKAFKTSWDTDLAWLCIPYPFTFQKFFPMNWVWYSCHYQPFSPVLDAIGWSGIYVMTHTGASKTV